MAWLKWVVVALVIVDAAYMAADGARALALGDYFTPRSGEHAGELGPWARLVESLGIDPRSTAMKVFFVVYGTGWLAATVSFALGERWAWLAMVLLAGGSLWYAIPGTVISVVTLVLLVLPAVRDQYTSS